MKFGKRIPRGVSEKKGLRDPFSVAAAQGRLIGWRDVTVIRSVDVGPRPVQTWNQQADLVLISPDGRLGVVECKLTRNAASRHGMFEQVILYAVMVRELSLEELGRRLKDAKRGVGCPVITPEIFQTFMTKHERNRVVVPIVVVDRWGSSLIRTAGRTLGFFNKALQSQGLQEIKIFALGDGGPELVWAANGYAAK